MAWSVRSVDMHLNLTRSPFCLTSTSLRSHLVACRNFLKASIGSLNFSLMYFPCHFPLSYHFVDRCPFSDLHAALFRKIKTSFGTNAPPKFRWDCMMSRNSAASFGLYPSLFAFSASCRTSRTNRPRDSPRLLEMSLTSSHN